MMPASTGIMPDVIRGKTRTQQASEHACSSAKGSFQSHRFFLSSFLPLFLLFNRYVYWKGRVRGRAARDRVSVSWFTSQLATAARAGPGQASSFIHISQEARGHPHCSSQAS